MKHLINQIFRKAGFEIHKYGEAVSFPNISYSQCGEDILIDLVFRLRNINLPSYIDIGANDPAYFNNTYKLYLKGSMGINVEPNSDLIKKYKKLRPRDLSLNIGVSSTEDELVFYSFKDNTLNTFSKTEADSLIDHGRELLGTKKIQTVPLETVLSKYWNSSFPDLLTIDVEGLDTEIICSIDFSRHFPKVICVETAEYSPIGAGKKREDLIDYILGKGYTIFADTNLNSIFVKDEFWFI